MSLEGQLRDQKSLRAVTGKTADWAELAKDCIAFANATGGQLLLGMEDGEDLPPAGQRIPADLPDTLRRKLADLRRRAEETLHPVGEAAVGDREEDLSGGAHLARPRYSATPQAPPKHSSAAGLRARGALGLVPSVTDTLRFVATADSLGGLRRYLARGGATTDSLQGALRATGVLTGQASRFALDATVEGSGLLVRTTTMRAYDRQEMSGILERLG